MPFETDPYRTLGLNRGASLDEVKRAYRRLAKANHPDAAGPAALTRFLAIQAAYEQLAGPSSGGTAPMTGRPTARSRSRPRPRPSEADPDRADATRRAYRGRARDTGPGAERDPGTRQGTAGGPARPERPGEADGRGRTGRGKATLGSTSYDDADPGQFEPDWGGASWYGTTSGTYWTINPKEYADPRKHGPEYQARARRAAGSRGGDAASGADAGGPDPAIGSQPDGAPSHSTASWWETTAGPADGADAQPRGTTGAADAGIAGDDAVHPASGGGPDGGRDTDRGAGRAALDLVRALTDPRAGGWRGRLVRAAIGWLPIALGIGWLVGELTGCGRFAATCDPSVMPLTAAGQGIAFVALFLAPEVAAIAAGAAMVLLASAIGAALILSATGTAADEGSRRAALGALLLVGWCSGLAIAVVRRLRSGSRSSSPVS